MHEYGAVKSIFDKVLNKMCNLNTGSVKSIHLVMGEISELNQNSIQKYWKEISNGTHAEDAELCFRVVTAEVQCMACFQKYRPEDGKIICPYCGSFGAKILSGEEFYLEAIEMEHG